jgi:hypothetical protein
MTVTDLNFCRHLTVFLLGIPSFTHDRMHVIQEIHVGGEKHESLASV